MFTVKGRNKSKRLTVNGAVVFMALLFFILLGPGLSNIDVSRASGGAGDWSNFCSRTAWYAFLACQNEVKDDFWITKGNCINVSNPALRNNCKDDASDERNEGEELCKDQLEARKEVCEDLGEDRYDPKLRPKDFNTPKQNPYFPLEPGTVWVYEGETEEGTETITVKVTYDTKEIEYPEDSDKWFTCIVVKDTVEFDGEVIEDTDDWYAVDNDGNVWYFGEIARNYEDGELVDLEGSWKAGRDFAKPGILMRANPDPDDEDQNPYRQEFALGDAEDLAEVISRDTAEVDVPYGSWGEGDDVVETRDFTPIEPDVEENKYYVPDVGLVLEVNPETGERVELLSKDTFPPPSP